jgi:hypothetical protein
MIQKRGATGWDAGYQLVVYYHSVMCDFMHNSALWMQA